MSLAICEVMNAEKNEFLTCRVAPNARKSEVVGWGADEKGRPLLMVKLKAPPVEGKANEELLRFIAELLSCAKGEVELVRGASSRVKVVSVPLGGKDCLSG